MKLILRIVSLIYGLSICPTVTHAETTLDPERTAIEMIRNSDLVGDPSSVQVKNVKEIDSEPKRYCGETTYITRGKGGWTGWVPFFSDGDWVVAKPDDSSFDLAVACLPRKEAYERARQKGRQGAEELARQIEKLSGPKAAADFRKQMNLE